MTINTKYDLQDIRRFLEQYKEAHPEDVLSISESISDNQDATAFVWKLNENNRSPMLHFRNVAGINAEVVTNIFASRQRIAHMLGAEIELLHEAYQERSRQAVAPVVVGSGPILDNIFSGADVNLNDLPILKHFATDRGKYITSGIIVSEDPETKAGNLSYHRSLITSKNELATSLHSHGHLWRLLNMAKQRGEAMQLAMVIGAHPLFMIAASARLSFGEDERDVAGGLLGEPLKVIKTPKYDISVPAYAEIVLEGTIDAEDFAEEGPFGEFTGYSSDRSTNNLLTVETILHRNDAMLISVAGGNSAEHLNLGRVPREAEMAEKLKHRFPNVTKVHYPNSGTHFHAYIAINQSRPGEARQVMLGLLGWDAYLKTVIAVDADVDITDDSNVLWALAVHFQPHKDVIMIKGLPGSALDPSVSETGNTSRMGLDATRAPEFGGILAKIDPEALQKASAILGRL